MIPFIKKKVKQEADETTKGTAANMGEKNNNAKVEIYA